MEEREHPRKKKLKEIRICRIKYENKAKQCNIYQT